MNSLERELELQLLALETFVEASEACLEPYPINSSQWDRREQLCRLAAALNTEQVYLLAAART